MSQYVMEKQLIEFVSENKGALFFPHMPFSIHL